MSEQLAFGLPARMGLAVVLCVAIAGSGYTLQRRPLEPITKETFLALKGERVKLIGNWPGSRYTAIGGDGSCFRKAKEPSASLPDADYAGKTGTIVEVEPSNISSARMVIELDGTGEKVVATCALGALGFFGEMELATKLVGNTFWAKGQLELLKPDDVKKTLEEAQHITVQNVDPLVVTRAEWGDARRPVYLCLKTPSGEEGCLMPRGRVAGNYYIDARFRVEYGSSPLDEVVYRQDPRALHRGWSQATWEQIQKEQVTVGMTEEMARLACGREMIPIMAESDAAGDVSMTYACRDRASRFVIKGGKVVKYFFQ